MNSKLIIFFIPCCDDASISTSKVFSYFKYPIQQGISAIRVLPIIDDNPSVRERNNAKDLVIKDGTIEFGMLFLNIQKLKIKL